jgi:hypothetical protein
MVDSTADIHIFITKPKDMMRTVLFGVMLAVPTAVLAQFPDGVTAIEAKPNQTVEVSGSLDNGKVLTDLKWASNSSVACFPATQNVKFNGNHVFFNTVIPKRSKMEITVIPDDPSANMSIYAYQVGTTNYTLPPSLASCVSCEAEHKWDLPKKNKTQDHTRTVFLNAVGAPYNVVIGVAGADGLTTGRFRVQVKLIGGEAPNVEVQKALTVTSVKLDNGQASVSGDLSSGVKVHDQSWAWNSAVACFPETQKPKFSGNHVLYQVDLPANSNMTITVTPTNPSHNLSIYAYQVGAGKDVVIPNLSSCVTCEADYKWDYPKKGQIQTTARTAKLNSIDNSYRVYIGVAGADGLTAAPFTLKIEVKPRQ